MREKKKKILACDEEWYFNDLPTLTDQCKKKFRPPSLDIESKEKR